MDLQQVDVWIRDHRAEMEQDIANLVAFPSVAQAGDDQAPYGNACAQVLTAMLELGQQYGFRIQNHANHCGSIYWGNGRREIGLWAHLDVVPAGDGWIYPPFSCTRQGEFLIGRGVQDNKGPAIVLLYAMRCLKDLGVSLNSTLRLVCGCCEETGMGDVAYFRKTQQFPEISLVADCDFPVCYGEKGILEGSFRLPLPADTAIADLRAGNVSNSIPGQAEILLRKAMVHSDCLAWLSDTCTVQEEGNLLRVAAKGCSAHVVSPERAVNAISLLCGELLRLGVCKEADTRVLVTLRRICADGWGNDLGIACQDQKSGRLLGSGTILRKEENVIRCVVNIRYPVTQNGEKIARQLFQFAQQEGAAFELTRNSPPYWRDPENPQVESLMQAYRLAFHQDKPAYVMSGGTYARGVENAFGFGPAFPMPMQKLHLPEGHGNCHGPDEAAYIPNLMQALKTYVLALPMLDRSF